jgi:hypothetical protein
LPRPTEFFHLKAFATSSRGRTENFCTTGRPVVWYAGKILYHGIIYTKRRHRQETIRNTPLYRLKFRICIIFPCGIGPDAMYSVRHNAAWLNALTINSSKFETWGYWIMI